jgi:FlaA1/EpsC-like NDP-sugar epimerase
MAATYGEIVTILVTGATGNIGRSNTFRPLMAA